MIHWVRNHCKPHVAGKMMLMFDSHKTQKTPSLLILLKDECNTFTFLVPPRCTSLVQPLDVVFDSPFKRAVDTLATSLMEAHVNDYLHGIFTAGERRILLTMTVRILLLVLVMKLKRMVLVLVIKRI